MYFFKKFTTKILRLMVLPCINVIIIFNVMQYRNICILPITQILDKQMLRCIKIYNNKIVKLDDLNNIKIQLQLKYSKYINRVRFTQGCRLMYLETFNVVTITCFKVHKPTTLGKSYPINIFTVF